MSQTEIFVPKLKYQKLIAAAEIVAIENDKKQDAITLRSAADTVKVLFEQYRYWWINETEMIFDRETGFLWQGNPDVSSAYNITNGQTVVKSLKLGGLLNWQVPTIEELKLIAINNFPLRSGAKYRLKDHCYWLTLSGRYDIDDGYWNIAPNENACILAKNVLFKTKPLTIDVLTTFIGKKWKIKPHGLETSHSNLKLFLESYESLLRLSYKTYDYKPPLKLSTIWKDLDHISTRLPKIENLRFSDTEQGVWEFYVPKALQKQYQKIETDEVIRARDPQKDIKKAKVGIDFGTSSTVVAIRSNGQDELLRIGLQEKDFKKHTLSDSDFENPTILEFLQIQQLLTAWKSEAYRPLVDWKTVHCSHEALTRFRENDSDPQIVGSIFARLKQWALRDATAPKVVVQGSEENREYEFDLLKELNPTKGQALDIQHKDYPILDPIELYAWFLGMNINWRERGIYLKYYMTFPVAYPNEVKEKILASFRRGLQRSLPESLIYSERFNEFSVQELASEPAAFAAAAIHVTDDIKPSQQGTAYAVFDFGGGTTDFDYGIYRIANEAEYTEGYDDVLEHFGASGDKYLGGENLLENLAYLTFKHNQNLCRDNEISFTKPIDAELFAGHERLVAQTQAAYTNTTLLMSKLRPLWERQVTDDGIKQLTLLNRHGQRVDCELTIPQAILISFLQERIRTGLKNFFIAMKASFSQQLGTMPTEVEILLAGNASRSKIVLGLLGRLEGDENQSLHDMLLTDLAQIFGENALDFNIHLPLQTDVNNPFKPTAKTGVALGLLRVSPGETLKVINHAQQANNNSPFQYYVGTHRRDVFSPVLKRNDNYDVWTELGAIRGGVFPLLYTTQPQALEGIKRGTNGLQEYDIEFFGSDTQGKKVFGKIISPDIIEIGLASGIEQIEAISHRRTIQLKVSS